VILTRLHRPMLKRQLEQRRASEDRAGAARVGHSQGERDGHRRALAELTQVTVLEPGQRDACIASQGPPRQPFWRVAIPPQRHALLSAKPVDPLSPRLREVIDFEAVQMAVSIQNDTVRVGDDVTHLVWWEWRPRGHTAFPVKSATHPEGGRW
jgi:hypothetical protein